MSRLAYRPDVDGLRAIAVIAVVVFHAWPELLPGGFVGVDVFFVLSGYLISGILFKAFAAGTFTFTDFYARRVRRIFPSLVAMLILCLAYGWLVLLPAEWRRLGEQTAWGAVFLQNVAFWNESGYFDTSTTLKPLLHLWSLAVEEQVYLVFPAAVALAWRFRWPLLPVLVTLFVASLIACLVATGREPSAAFFLTPFRAWEFLAGSILAWVHDRRGAPTVRTWRLEAASWCGLALLAVGLAWIAEGEGFPGWRAAIPVAGTVLVLAAGSGATANRWLLSLKPIVWVGLVSYPLYLFHWPLLSFLHVLKGPKPDPGLVWGAVALGLVLAAAAYYGVEKPVRPSRWKGTVPALLAAFLTIGGLGLGVASEAIPSKPLPDEARLIDEAIAEATDSWSRYQEGFRRKAVNDVRIARIDGQGRKTLFLGDSTVMMLGPRIRRLIEDAGDGSRGAVIVAGGGTCAIPGVSNPTRPGQDQLMAVFEDELEADPSIDRVVIGGHWAPYFAATGGCSIGTDPLEFEPGRTAALAALGDLIRRLASSGKKVFVVLPVPFGPEFDPRRMRVRDLLGGGTVRLSAYTLSEHRSRSGSIRADLARIASESGAETLDPVPTLIQDGVGITIDDEGPTFFDQLHFRPAFSRNHATYVDRTLVDVPAAGAEGRPAASRDRAEWRLLTHAGAEATLSTAEGGPMRIEIQTRSGETGGDVQLVGEPLAVETGARYTVSFRVRSDAPRTIAVLAVAEPPESGPVGLAREIEVSTEWRDVRLDFVATKSDPAARVRFNLGADDAAVEFADVDVGTQRWYLRAPGNSGAALGLVSGRPGAVRVTIDGATDPKKPWIFRLHGPPFAVEEGEELVVSFRARADAPRSIVAKVSAARQPGTSLGFYKVVELSPDWDDFVFRFTPNATIAEAQLDLMLGADATAVEFESVRVRSVSWSGRAGRPRTSNRRRGEAERPRTSRISDRKRRSRMIPASRMADPSRAPEPEGRTSGTP